MIREKAKVPIWRGQAVTGDCMWNWQSTGPHRMCRVLALVDTRANWSLIYGNP